MYPNYFSFGPASRWWASPELWIGTKLLSGSAAACRNATLAYMSFLLTCKVRWNIEMHNWSDGVLDKCEAENDPDLLGSIAEYAHGWWGALRLKSAGVWEHLLCRWLAIRMLQDGGISWKEWSACAWWRFNTCITFRRGRLRAWSLNYSRQHTVSGSYRNIQIHDPVPGTQATVWKEVIQREQIEAHMELGKVGLLEESHEMM